MKKINYLLTIVFFTFCVALKVNAALPNSLGTIDQVGEKVTDTSEYGMALKVNNARTYATICTHYYSNTPATTGVECIKNDDWDEATRYGVAAIINAARPSITMTSITNEYFASELAINKFINTKSSEYGADINGSILSATYSSLYNNYLSLANNAYNSYNNEANVSINLSLNYLYFEQDGSEYVSNTITVSGVSDYNVTSNIGEVSRTGSSFKIIVSEDEISSITNVTATVTASKELAQARNYTCGTYQSLTPNAVETVTKTGTRTIEGTIEPTGTIVIKKVDKSGNYISDSKIKIKCISESCDYEEIITTRGRAYTIEGVPMGIYLIQEVEAPDGYILNTTGKTVRIDASNLNHTVKIVNTMTKLEISKIDARTGKFLPGVVLQIEDENGKVVKYCVDERGNKNSECKWKTENEMKVITGLPYGKYYLVEVSAPEGYELFEDKMEFSLSEENSSISIELENYLEVDVPDTLNSKSALLVAISMFDIALGIGIISYVKKNKIEE